MAPAEHYSLQWLQPGACLRIRHTFSGYSDQQCGGLWLPGPEGVVVIVVAISSARVVIGQLGTNQMAVQEASRASDQKPTHTHVRVSVSHTNAGTGRSHLTWPLHSEKVWVWTRLGGGKRKGRTIRPPVMGEGVDEELPGNEVVALRWPGPRRSSEASSGALPPSHCCHVTF